MVGYCGLGVALVTALLIRKAGSAADGEEKEGGTGERESSKRGQAVEGGGGGGMGEALAMCCFGIKDCDSK